jgi:carbonic anhydrase
MISSKPSILDRAVIPVISLAMLLIASPYSYGRAAPSAPQARSAKSENHDHSRNHTDHAPTSGSMKDQASSQNPLDESSAEQQPEAKSVEPTPAAALAHSADDVRSPSASLDLLREGNARFVLGETLHPRSGADRRYETAQHGQQPVAAILSCADSRVPPEILFDQGVGDLFVVRVAGNVVDPHQLASLEYGAEHLKIPVLVVMGHTKCGAVAAVASNAPLRGNLPALADAIQPAVAAARRDLQTNASARTAAPPSAQADRLTSLAVRYNVRQAQYDLFAHSDTLRELVARGSLRVVGAVYDLHSGSVLWLGEHPEQAAILDGQTPADSAVTTAYTSNDAHARVDARASESSHARVGTHKSSDAHADAHDTDHDDPHETAGLLNKGHDHEGKADVSHGKADVSHGKADVSHGKADVSHGKADESHGKAEDAHATKVEKHGLWVPAAFMLGGVALSSSIVVALRTRRPTPAPAPTTAPTDHAAH